MQNQWFGDEGDFVKYRLLRQICGITAKADDPRLSLGVVWYKRESKNLSYLETRKGGKDYEREDGDLFRTLQAWMQDERSRGVSLMENSFLFPDNTVWFSDLVPNSDGDRDRWLNRALATVERCGVVFLDPDTGLQPKKGTGKHVLWKELKKFCEAAPAPTVVVYQHSRRKKLSNQVEEQTAQIKEQSGRDCVVAVSARAHDQRLFYVIPAKGSREVVLTRVRDLKWCTSPDLGRYSVSAG